MDKWWAEGSLKLWCERQVSYVKLMTCLVADIKGAEWETRWAEIAKLRTDMMARVKAGLPLPTPGQPLALLPTDAQAYAAQVCKTCLISGCTWAVQACWSARGLD